MPTISHMAVTTQKDILHLVQRKTSRRCPCRLLHLCLRYVSTIHLVRFLTFRHRGIRLIIRMKINLATYDFYLHSRHSPFNEPSSRGAQVKSIPFPQTLRNLHKLPRTREMMAATKHFYPAPEDLELVSVLMNMKAGVPQDRSSPVSVLSPVNKRKASSLHRNPLAPSIPQSHFIMDRMKPPWGHPHPSATVLRKQTRPIPTTRHPTAAGSHVQVRDNTVQNPPAYTPEQRKKALERFKEKKRRRTNSHGQIRYQVRKRLADTRPRHRGRFFKPKSVETPRPSSDQVKVVK